MANLKYFIAFKGEKDYGCLTSAVAVITVVVTN